MKSYDPFDAFDRAIGEDIGRNVPPKFYVADLAMPDARELMMLSRLLIVPRIVHATEIIGVMVNLCLLMLSHRGSILLQWSHIMNAPEII